MPVRHTFAWVCKVATDQLTEERRHPKCAASYHGLELWTPEAKGASEQRTGLAPLSSAFPVSHIWGAGMAHRDRTLTPQAQIDISSPNYLIFFLTWSWSQQWDTVTPFQYVNVVTLIFSFYISTNLSKLWLCSLLALEGATRRRKNRKMWASRL